MTNLDRLMIERECERLVSLYTHYADFGEAERVAELFARDAVWAVGPIRFEGQGKIRQMMRERQEMAGRRSRHVCTNLQIDVLDENNASGLVYLTLYRHDFEGPEREAGEVMQTAPTAVGEYRDRFVRTDAGWRFSERHAALAFGKL